MRTLDSWRKQADALRQQHTEQTKAEQWAQAQTTQTKLIMALNKISELEAPKVESRGESLANDLLENESAERWDKVLATTKHLFRQHRQADKLMHELARSIGYNRALAQVGLKREDVDHPLVGDQIMATDNYKRTHPVKACRNEHCNHKGRPQKGEACAYCDEPLETSDTPISGYDLRKTYPRHIVGVVLKDGRRVWFNGPLSNTPWTEWDKEEQPTAADPTKILGQMEALD